MGCVEWLPASSEACPRPTLTRHLRSTVVCHSSQRRHGPAPRVGSAPVDGTTRKIWRRNSTAEAASSSARPQAVDPLTRRRSVLLIPGAAHSSLALRVSGAALPCSSSEA